MATVSFYTMVPVLIFTPSKDPVYTVETGWKKNVVSGETLGGKIRSETRGSDRRTMRFTWRRLPSTDVANFVSLFASYGQNKAQFKAEVAEYTFPGQSGAVKYTVRWPDATLEHPLVAYGRYNLTMTLVEDL